MFASVVGIFLVLAASAVEEFELGNRALDLGKAKEAAEHYSRALSFDGLNARQRSAILRNRGSALDDLGRYSEALADFDLALELEPDNSDNFIDRGVTLGKLGRYDLAIKDFGRAIELSPGLAEIYNNRGIVYGRMGDFSSAIADFNRAVALEPDDPFSYFNRGLAYESAGKIDAARRDFTKALDLAPDHPLIRRKALELGDSG